MPLILLVSLAHADCHATVADLDAEARRALDAYGELDIQAFREAQGKAVALLPCLHEPATPEAAWELHVVHGLAAWVDRDTPGARAAFRAARATVPSLELSPLLAPDGSHARVLWAAAEVDGPGALLAAPPGRWRLDGQPDVAELPTERAALVQRVAPDGGVEATWYFARGVPPDAFGQPPRALLERPRLVAGGALALGGAAALIGAGALRVAHREVRPQDAEPYFLANVATSGLGVAALGTAVAFISIEAIRW